MGSDKFDFHTASSLVQAVDAAAAALEIKNDEMKRTFGNLREGFKDDGYNKYESDMSAANSTLQEVVKQMRAVAASIARYAEALKPQLIP